MLFQFLDTLRSQADRAALADAVGRELAAPVELARAYGRLVSESLQAQTARENPHLDLERVIAKATAEQVHWLGGVFRQDFLTRAHRMLEWAHRLKLTAPIDDWSPLDWVSASRELEAEGDLLCLVIERADTLSWPAWHDAFSRQRNWSTQWMGWEQAFARAPGLASRWLEFLLTPPAEENESERQSRLDRVSFSRGRLWQKIHANESAGRPVELLKDLDARLASAGAHRRLDCVDYGVLLRRDGHLVPPSRAREVLMGFFQSSPDAARQWLAPLAGCASSPSVPPALGADRADSRGLAMLSWLAAHGQCGAPEMRDVFNHWATLLDDADWEHVLDKAFLSSFGITVEEPPKSTAAAPPGNKKAKSPKKKSTGQSKKPDSAASVPAKASSSPPTSERSPPTPAPEPLPVIPRFSPRK